MVQLEIADRIAAYCGEQGTAKPPAPAVSDAGAREEAKLRGVLKEKERQLAALEAEQAQLVDHGSGGRHREQHESQLAAALEQASTVQFDKSPATQISVMYLTRELRD